LAAGAAGIAAETESTSMDFGEEEEEGAVLTRRGVGVRPAGLAIQAH